MISVATLLERYFSVAFFSESTDFDLLVNLVLLTFSFNLTCPVLYDGSSGALTAGNSINSNSNNSSSSSSNNNNSSSTVSAAAAATLANNLNNMNNNGAGVVGSGRGGSGVVAPSQTPLAPPSAPTGEAHIPPLLGVAPLGPMALSKEQQVGHRRPYVPPPPSRARIDSRSLYLSRPLDQGPRLLRLSIGEGLGRGGTVHKRFLNSDLVESFSLQRP